MRHSKRCGTPRSARSQDLPAVLVLEDGSVFRGRGLGSFGHALGEVCFNTSMTGYQEILTDPSYAGQIITFAFPHIGNVGTNPQDVESGRPACRGLIVRESITAPSNWRSLEPLDVWLRRRHLIGLCEVDTRRLVRRIRRAGAPRGCLAFHQDGDYDIAELRQAALQWPGLEGTDLTAEVSCSEAYEWTGPPTRATGENAPAAQRPLHVVCVDYGVKHNILRSFIGLGCRVTVVPARASAAAILELEPDGVFLSNGPGDPQATGVFAVPVIWDLLRCELPIFGICLGHQLLALALGARTAKAHVGHRGANHPVLQRHSGQVHITSQNHGFVVLRDSLPDSVVETHVSLFDGTLEGLRVEERPVWSVQFHPEANPGPQDCQPLFQQFVEQVQERKVRGHAQAN